MTRSPLSQDQAIELLQRYRTGTESVRELAAAFGVGRHYPAKLARRGGQSLRCPERSTAPRARNRAAAWKPEPDQAPPRCAPGDDIRGRLLAGVPMLLIAADLDIGLSEVVAAARTS